MDRQAAVRRRPHGEPECLADTLTAQRGVRYADLHMVPVEVLAGRHDHGAGGAPHAHIRA